MNGYFILVICGDILEFSTTNFGCNNLEAVAHPSYALYLNLSYFYLLENSQIFTKILDKCRIR